MLFHRTPTGLLWLLALAFLLPACAGSGKTTTSEDDTEEPAALPTPAPEPEEPTRPPEPEPTPDEDAPPRAVTVQGFRVQVLTTSEKAEADALAGEAERWWRDLSASEKAGMKARGDLPIEVAWRAPYYRVQMGAYTSRAAAQQALQMLSSRFPKAFIVPSRVTVMR